ncbi:MAG: efflux RND transporter permease subunit [Acetobacteraceae bacterium]|nr:efflux RND transporter permease subunit [Acetobacteraceae bacterium]MSP30508.1 efflux RND transporter permease subunit [Acetobacteraceae bacterium]
MLALVQLALRRPYTSAIAALLILMMGAMSVTRMTVDIFPTIDIPVVMVVWNYPGLTTEDMERRVVFITERAYSTTVNGIQRIESQSIPGTGLLKVYFQPGTDIGGAIAQITAVNNSILRIAPPGMQPPAVIQFNASNVPVVQMTLSSESLTEQQIYDHSLNFIRVRLFTIPGLSTPGPFGGRQRQIIVELDQDRLVAKGFSPVDVVNALQASNVIVPAGTARLGDREYNVQLNSSPPSVEQFNSLPLGVFAGAPVTLGDVAGVSDSFAVQNNVVHVNGKRAVYLAILKHATASTIAVVDAARAALPQIKAAAPDGLEIKLDFDQSIFVRAAVENVVKEAVLSSVLVSVLILVFLGSWRNTVIVATSIPLSIFAGITGLYFTGNTINLMTLGGLALAIGLLVDNATVTMENIHRNQMLGKPLTVAILDGTAEVIQPLTVATLAICIVFFPVVLLVGVSRYLFIPLAITVVLCMLASYVLSFSVVPSFARFLLKDSHDASPPRGFAGAFDRAFNGFRDGVYGYILAATLRQRAAVLVCTTAFCVVTGGLATTIGMDFFPAADVGLIKLHYRAPAGTKLEETERQVLRLQQRLREIIPPEELETINDNIGIPSSFNLAFVPSDNVGPMDAEILISLKHGHRPTIGYIRTIREQLPSEFPGAIIYFQTADIVSQVLNFGLPAPIDIQIQDTNFERAYTLGQKLLRKLLVIPGVADPHIVQVLNYPALQVEVDRLRAIRLGISQRDVASNMLTSLSSSSLVAPNFFLNPQNNVNYSVAVRTPLSRVNSIEDLLNTPISRPDASVAATPTTLPSASVIRLADIASITQRSSLASVNHYTVQRVINIAANVDGRDLGGVARDIQKAIDELSKDLPVTVRIDIRGQYEVMQASFRLLALGMILAVILVYALLVILFQSWVDPFIIMMAVPGALVGIIWMLAITGTTINVESLMGAIMSVGISVSNSILIVSFANDLRARQDHGAMAAVIEAGRIRLRPILMTALAMIIGMIPMALGLGDAGEQNAPLGRAVIGGLIMATLTTLFIVPIGYTLLRRRPPALHSLDARFAAEAAGGGAGGVKQHD